MSEPTAHFGSASKSKVDYLSGIRRLLRHYEIPFAVLDYDGLHKTIIELASTNAGNSRDRIALVIKGRFEEVNGTSPLSATGGTAVEEFQKENVTSVQAVLHHLNTATKSRNHVLKSDGFSFHSSDTTRELQEA